MPSPASLVAICHDCDLRITDFAGAPYDLPTSCPVCQHALLSRPLRENLKEKPPAPPKTTNRSRHRPLDQRAAARAALKSNAGISPGLLTGSALETGAGEPKQQHGGQRRKRRWTMAEKASAKMAKRGRGGEDGEEAVAVRVDSEAAEDEDDVVFVKKVTRNEIG